MNIFFLHLNQRLCALYHCDKHVVKMILETLQILCSVHHVSQEFYKEDRAEAEADYDLMTYDVAAYDEFNPSHTIPYKLTHQNHPCSVWARESLSNYLWLTKLGIELCKEYTYRYGKTHKCEPLIYEMFDNFPAIPDVGFTTPAQAMPDEYKNKSFVKAYRAYYLGEKKRMLVWKKRDIPAWVGWN